MTKMMPRKLKKRRMVMGDDGEEQGWEEYYDYQVRCATQRPRRAPHAPFTFPRTPRPAPLTPRPDAQFPDEQKAPVNLKILEMAHAWKKGKGGGGGGGGAVEWRCARWSSCRFAGAALTRPPPPITRHLLPITRNHCHSHATTRRGKPMAILEAGGGGVRASHLVLDRSSIAHSHLSATTRLVAIARIML